MSDLTVKRRPVDPFPGVTLKERRVELSIKALELEIFRSENEILEHQEHIDQIRGTIEATKTKIVELETVLKQIKGE